MKVFNLSLRDFISFCSLSCDIEMILHFNLKKSFAKYYVTKKMNSQLINIMIIIF